MAEPLRIAFLGPNYAPEPIGIARYTADLAEELAARGHAVEAVVAQPYYPDWAPYPGHGNGWWRRSEERGVRVLRCPHYIPRRPTGLKRIVHLLSFALSALLPMLALGLRGKGRRPDLIVCVIPALFAVPVAWLAARLAGAKLWLHVQDFELEAALATGLLERGAGLGARIERLLLRLGDRVSSISPKMCAAVAAKGVASERIVELRNWADDALFETATGEAFRREWAIGARTVAFYSGNISRKQGIGVLLDAARLLTGRTDLVFVICGNGPERPSLEAEAAGLGNVLIRDLQPAERMGELLAMADLHLLPQLAGVADLVLPSKLTNMQASGRPVLATAAPGTGLYAEVEGAGLCTPPGDAAALAAAIAELADDPKRRAALGTEARRRARVRYYRPEVVDRFEREAKVLCSKS